MMMLSCRLSKSSTWSAVEEVQNKLKEKDEKEKIAPRLFRAFLNITGTPRDTFVKLDVSLGLSCYTLHYRFVVTVVSTGICLNPML